MDGWLAKCRLRAKFAGASARGPGCRLADWEICATCAVDSAWRVWRFHNSWRLGEAWTHHGCGDLSGVNGTPLLRGIEFTHAPAQAGERMAGMRWKGKLEPVFYILTKACG